MIFNCDIARSLASPLSVSDRIQDRPLAPDDGQKNSFDSRSRPHCSVDYVLISARANRSIAAWRPTR